MMNLRRYAATTACLLTVGGTAAAAPSKPTDVEGIEIVADLDVRLSVAVAGDIGEKSVVTSAPVGLNCGGALYQYTPRENRQCWLYVRRNRPVLLAAQANGRYGSDWRVEWSGCQPVAGGAGCEVLPKDESSVIATFVRLTPTG